MPAETTANDLIFDNPFASESHESRLFDAAAATLVNMRDLFEDLGLSQEAFDESFEPLCKALRSASPRT